MVKKKYICHSKYYGRRLDLQGVRRTLSQFLDNGAVVRWDVVEPVVRKLKSLLRMLSNQESFRWVGGFGG